MHRPIDIETLLAEESWIRRIARDLVSDDARADDVTQDVVREALEKRPMVSGESLRAWLRTVTRRTAGRQRERERTQVRVEAKAAKVEAVPDTTDDARERLRLHRRVNEAIDALPPIYRTALVMRYLEGMQPLQIAKQLDLSPTVARKRVSHGLTLVRKELDGAFGNRGDWMHSVGILAFGDAWSAAAKLSVPVGAAVSPAPLLIWISMKNAVLGVLVATAMIFAVVKILDSGDSDSEAIMMGGLEQEGLDAVEQTSTWKGDVALTPKPSSRRVIEEDLSQSQASPSDAEEGLQGDGAFGRLDLMVVDPDGKPLPGIVLHVNPKDGLHVGHNLQVGLTDQGGHWKTTKIAAGRVNIVGPACNFQSVQVTAGQDNEATLTLKNVISAKGVVVDQ